MKLQIKYTFLIVLAAVIFACKDKNNDVTPEPKPDEDTTPVVVTPKDSVIDTYTTLKANGVIEVKDLPALKGTDANYAEYSLYSFEKMKLVGVGEDSMRTAGWNLAFSNATGIDVMINWGGTAPYYWDVLDQVAGNPSDIKTISFRDTTFDAVTTAPLAVDTLHQYALTMGEEVMNTETGLLDHYKFVNSVVVFKLNDGRYMKFQYISYYKGAPANPTAQDHRDNKGYWSFRYYIAKEGSKDLSTATK